VEIIKGTGKITGKGKVEVNGNNYATKNIIIASGARWIRAGFLGADLDGVINSDGLLVSKALPQRVLLFDRSPHILEIAQFLHRFGSRVFVATPEKSILQDESKVIRSRLSKALKSQGIDIRVGAELEMVERVEEGLLCTLDAKGKKETTVVDRVITMRRKAALSDLGLESVGLDHTGPHISVNNRMETAVAGIYAVGDVACPEKSHYSHLASSGGIIAAENAMGKDAEVNRRTICRVLYTQPQVACVGLTEKEAKKQGYDVITGSAPLSMNTFGMIIAQEEGIVQIVAEKRYGQVIGVHFIGGSAAEMAAQAVIAIQLESVLEDFVKAPFPHPTLSESVSEAARDCLGRPIYLP
jgi:dihydrolipoamide dehydrogenase